ncbi:hypothetical protein FEE95_13405 [Maribacter algarum]|uniref:Uncharacterized protein n=1 Tax=Maribacter algarum (ex Zhang et al. 2020) TaxID=2578118 RepID=A0A5S3QIS6_9FLAO|nr:hypothetical protein [Maribacter algarum]TMM57475.1 hypothetical protein FEE95_13405 [Maribacter algarum]
MAIFAPTAIKTAHALFEHQELFCFDKSTTHVHEVEFDCDFQKFKLSPQHYPVFVNVQEFLAPFTKERDKNHYTFLSQYQRLSFALRGPPLTS